MITLRGTADVLPEILSSVSQLFSLTTVQLDRLKKKNPMHKYIRRLRLSIYFLITFTFFRVAVAIRYKSMEIGLEIDARGTLRYGLGPT